MKYDLKITVTCDVAKIIYALSAFIFTAYKIGLL